MRKDKNGNLIITCQSSQIAPSKYRLDSVTSGKFPRRKYYETHGDMLEAVERANPGRSFSWNADAEIAAHRVSGEPAETEFQFLTR